MGGISRGCGSFPVIPFSCFLYAVILVWLPWAPPVTKQKTSVLLRTNVKSVVPPRLSGYKKSPGDAPGDLASFTRLRGTAKMRIPFTLITVALPARVTRFPFSPATPRSIQHHRACRFSPFPALCNVDVILTRPLQSL